jgi:hypothetical protein
VCEERESEREKEKKKRERERERESKANGSLKFLFEFFFAFLGVILYVFRWYLFLLTLLVIKSLQKWRYRKNSGRKSWKIRLLVQTATVAAQHRHRIIISSSLAVVSLARYAVEPVAYLGQLDRYSRASCATFRPSSLSIAHHLQIFLLLF